MELATKVLVKLMKLGIKFKLVTFIASLLVIVILFLSISVLSGIKNYQKKENEAILFNQKTMYEQFIQEQFDSNSNKAADAAITSIRSKIFNTSWLKTMPAKLLDNKGKILQTYKMQPFIGEVEDEDKMLNFAMEDKIAYKQVENSIYFFSPLKYKNKTVAIIELNYSVERGNEFYSNIKKLFLIVGFLALTIGIALGIAYLLQFTKAIYKIKLSVESIQKGEFNNIVAVKRKDELGELSEGISCMSEAIKNNIMELNKEKDTLNKAVDKLKRMDKQQKEFIGNVSHEFKTPLTAIKAYADVMAMYKDDESFMEEAIENISKESERLRCMVERVLSLATLEKYEFEIRKEQVNLKTLLEEISSRMMGKIRKSKLTLESDFEDITVLGDGEGLRHIIINLIDNAIKYNQPEGTINLKSYSFKKNAYIEVSDTGIGMNSEHLSKIFEPFYRIDSNRSRSTGGNGLGLALVKKFVEKQNGEIEVQSEENKGTRFIIKFPI